MKKTVLPFMAFLLLLLISMSYFSVTKAQPLFIEMGVPTEPFNSPPNIQIITPYQNQTFNSPNVSLNFSVIIPNSWAFNTGQPNDIIRTIWGNITSVSYSLDNNQLQNLTLDKVNIPYPTNSSQNLNFSVHLNFTEGVHVIRIFVSGYTYYVLNPLDSMVMPLQLASVPVEANTTVSFNVALPISIVKSPQNTEKNESTIPFIVITVVIVCLIAGLLFYRRHRKTANLSK
jgi:hypothetical protein